jgi:hypothetical protein
MFQDQLPVALFHKVLALPVVFVSMMVVVVVTGSQSIVVVVDVGP